ncbi:MAG: PAC2 family protein [Actinomycetota bacterium]|nr:PAC2 family protein [Actinomycetota bacterium]
MSQLVWEGEAELNRPLFVIALEGLFDAAGAATNSVDRLVTTYNAKPLAHIDPEIFFNFQEERPIVRIADHGREIVWPTNSIWAAKCPNENHDLVLLSGVEPHLRWRSFADSLLEIAQSTNAEMVIPLGAMAGRAPHTRPWGVVGSAADPATADRLGLGRPTYEGPTGLVGALHDQLDKAGMPVISLRVSVPHYVPNPPNPEATRSLLSRLELVTGVQTLHGELEQAANDWRKRIDLAVSNDDEMANYVQQLEQRVDESEILPTGDDLAAELEAFLRDRRED